MYDKELKPTLAMIVKDCADSVGKAIESALEFCAGIVVVDTGSSDDTIKVCKNFGAETYFYAWDGSFSNARNYALSFVESSWVLSLDADEILEGDSMRRNIHLLKNDNAGGLSVIIENELKTGDYKSVSKHRYTRIFRNDPRIRFTGRVHEQIAESIVAAGFEIIETDVKIAHSGYLSTDSKKIERNLIALKADLSENPEDPFLLYHLAETLFAKGDYEAALKEFDKVKNSRYLNASQQEISRIRLAQIFLKRNDYTAVLKELDFVSVNIDVEGFRNYLIAIVAASERDFKSAADLLELKETQESDLVDKEQYFKLKAALRQFV